MPRKRVLHQGDVLLVPFPFADLMASKVRPAVVVSADPQHAAFITSVTTNHSPRGAEVPLVQSDSEFSSTGLKMDSLVRLDKLVTLSQTVVRRRLGKVGASTKTQIEVMLRRSFEL